MTPLHILTLMLLVQIVGYLLLDKLNLSGLKYLLLVLLLLADFVLLPRYFIADIQNDKPGCAMPTMAITFVFWLLGAGTVILAHFIYVVLHVIKKKRRKCQAATAPNP